MKDRSASARASDLGLLICHFLAISTSLNDELGVEYDIGVSRHCGVGRKTYKMLSSNIGGEETAP